MCMFMCVWGGGGGGQGAGGEVLETKLFFRRGGGVRVRVSSLRRSDRKVGIPYL